MQILRSLSQTVTPTLTPSNPSRDTADTERALADEQAALAAGFAIRPPLYTIGTPVNALGVENFARSRRAFEALPFATDACAELATRVEAERRSDFPVNATELHMLADGRLRSELGHLPISERALEGLCRLVTPGGAGYLTACPPALRATNVNHWLERASRRDRQGNVKPRELILRARQTERGAEVFSVVGPRYSPLDIDVIATQLHSLIPNDARAEVFYDGYRARISIVFHSNIAPERCVAGEIFQAGVSITTADDGTGSIRVAAQVYRNLCLNLIIIDRAEQGTVTRHVGDNLADAVKRGIERALKKVSYFGDKWSDANVENVLERYGVDDVATVFRALASTRAVHVSGVSTDEMVERLQRAWDFEPGYSKAAIVNAITRAAHTEEWRSWQTTEELERTAGELLYARVWNVQAPAASSPDW
jgi:hypothetical protein